MRERRFARKSASSSTAAAMLTYPKARNIFGSGRFTPHPSGRSIFQQLPRNHQPLNLAGAFANGAQLHVAVILLGRIVFDEAVSAMNLYAFIGASNGHFAGVMLRHRWFQRGLHAYIFH